MSQAFLLQPKPILRWAGSKRQVVTHLSSYWNSGYKRYVEPFAGSCSLFFTVQPQEALLADLNGELIGVYKVLRKHPKRLHRVVLALPKSRKFYNKLRERDPTKMPAFDRAVRFVYLNRFCFNGLYRTNRQGKFNVPYAPNGTGDFPSVEQFQACAMLLRGAELRAWDFGTTLRYVRKGDFVYIDPPYAVENRRIFCEYGPRPFTKSDLKRLGGHLKQIDARGAKFLVSYADCAEARAIFRGWDIHRLAVRRNIAGFSGARKKSYEVVVTNTNVRLNGGKLGG